LDQLIEANCTTWAKLLTVSPDGTEDAVWAAEEIVRSHPSVVIFMYEKVQDIDYMKKVRFTL
jgi:hypothetical protein